MQNKSQTDVLPYIETGRIIFQNLLNQVFVTNSLFEMNEKDFCAGQEL